MPAQNTTKSPEEHPRRLRRGLVHIYTGEGKGKTTAALGLALRAAGSGLRVHLIHFLKGRSAYSEGQALKLLPQVTVSRPGHQGFLRGRAPSEADLREAQETLRLAREAALGGEYAVVILDEVCVAISLGLLPEGDIADLIARKPESVELILTGRGASPGLVELADLVTEMREVKHPYQRGIKARRGIDF